MFCLWKGWNSGVKLLQKMGWRQGKGIGEAFQTGNDLETGFWGPDASLAQNKSIAWKEKPKVCSFVFHSMIKR